MIRWLHRLAGAVLIALIVIATPLAFWLFNIGRVALNPQTYKDVLHDPGSYDDLYSDLLPAVIDGATRNLGDATARTALLPVVNAIPAAGWNVISDKLPQSWLQDQLDGDFAHLFSWLNGTRPTLGVVFDLQMFKTALTANKGQIIVGALLPALPNCSASQEQKISSAADVPPSTAPDALPPVLPMCNPSKAGQRSTLTNDLTTQFYTLAGLLPARIDLTVQLHRAEIGSSGQHVSDFDIEQARSAIVVATRLAGLLLLLPLALLCLIVIIFIRSWKSFFRWTGWILVVSSLIAAVLVPILPALMTGAYAASRTNVEKWFGSSGRLVGSLLSGMIGSVASGLTMAALIQISVALALGFIALVISILLTGPVTDLSTVSHDTELSSASSTTGWNAARPAHLISASSETPPPRGTTTSKKIGGKP